ncbi:Regulator of Microtubule Dynamics [Homalodisca vitripennis]|nr:Regulator of Microtubule Dynamics [Homalodisca vitripennis]
MFRKILCGNVPFQDVFAELNKTSLPWNKTLSMLNHTQRFQLLLDIERREAEKKMSFMLQSQRITKAKRKINSLDIFHGRIMSHGRIMLNHTQRFQLLLDIERREAEKKMRFMLQSQRITKGEKENELFTYPPRNVGETLNFDIDCDLQSQLSEVVEAERAVWQAYTVGRARTTQVSSEIFDGMKGAKQSVAQSGTSQSQHIVSRHCCSLTLVYLHTWHALFGLSLLSVAGMVAGKCRAGSLRGASYQEISEEAFFRDDDDILWRLAKTCYGLAIQYERMSNKEEYKEMIYKGVEYGQKAIDINKWNGNAHKWFAVCVGIRGQLQGVTGKLMDSQLFKIHLDKALTINPTDPTLHHLRGRYHLELLLDIERREPKKNMGFMLQSQRITKGEKENELFRYPPWQDYVPWQDVISELNKTSLPWNKTLTRNVGETLNFDIDCDLQSQLSEVVEAERAVWQAYTVGTARTYRKKRGREKDEIHATISTHYKSEKENELFRYPPWQDHVPWQDVITELNKTSLPWNKTLTRNVGETLNFDIDCDLQSQLSEVVEAERAVWQAYTVGRARTSVYHKQYLTLDLDLGNRTFLTDNLKISVRSWAIKILSGNNRDRLLTDYILQPRYPLQFKQFLITTVSITHKPQLLLDIGRREAEKKMRFMLQSQRITKGEKENELFTYPPRNVGETLNFDIDCDLQSQLSEVVEAERAVWQAYTVGRARTSVYHKQYLTLDLDLGNRTFLTDNLKISVRSWAIKTSVYHKQYLTLDLDLGNRTFVTDKLKISVMSWAIKVRAELVDLNYKPWKILCGNVPWQNVFAELNKTSLPWNKTLSMLNHTQRFQLLLDIGRREAEKKMRFMLQSQRNTKDEREKELFKYPPRQYYVPWQNIIAELNKTSLHRNKTLTRNVGETLNFDIDCDLQSQLSEVVEAERAVWQAYTVGRARTSVYHKQYLTLDLDLGNRTFLTDNLKISVRSWAIKLLLDIERREAEKKMSLMLQSQRITKGEKENELFTYPPRNVGETLNFDIDCDLQSQLSEVVEAERAVWQAYTVGRARASVYHKQYLTLDLDLGNRTFLTDNLKISVRSWAIKDVFAELNKTSIPWNKTLSMLNHTQRFQLLLDIERREAEKKMRFMLQSQRITKAKRKTNSLDIRHGRIMSHGKFDLGTKFLYTFFFIFDESISSRFPASY